MQALLCSVALVIINLNFVQTCDYDRIVVSMSHLQQLLGHHCFQQIGVHLRQLTYMVHQQYTVTFVEHQPMNNIIILSSPQAFFYFDPMPMCMSVFGVFCV